MLSYHGQHDHELVNTSGGQFIEMKQISKDKFFPRRTCSHLLLDSCRACFFLMFRKKKEARERIQRWIERGVHDRMGSERLR